MLILIMLQFSSFANANPSIPPDIPPIVSVPEMSYNATVSILDNQPWAFVDIEYATFTIHAYGESYYLPKEFPSDTDPNPYIKYTVITDKLEADYPIPLNATNIYVKVNEEEKNWQNKKGIYHLYDIDMPRITWVIQPVPSDFKVNVHYEQPLSKTNDEYVLIIPLGQRYGSTEASYYPLYDWFGYGTPTGSIKIKTELDYQMTAYAVNSTGSLRLISDSNFIDNKTLSVDILETNEWHFPFGVVVIMKTEGSQVSNEFFQLDLVLVIVSLSIAVALGLVYYRKNRFKRTN